MPPLHGALLSSPLPSAPRELYLCRTHRLLFESAAVPLASNSDILLHGLAAALTGALPGAALSRMLPKGGIRKRGVRFAPPGERHVGDARIASRFDGVTVPNSHLALVQISRFP